MKRRLTRFSSVIEDVLLHAGVGGCADAEIHAIAKDGERFVYHYLRPSDTDLAVLKDSVGKYFQIEVAKLERGRV